MVAYFATVRTHTDQGSWGEETAFRLLQAIEDSRPKMTIVDAQDLPVTNVSKAERDIFEQALGQFQTYTGDPVATIEGAFAATPLCSRRREKT